MPCSEVKVISTFRNVLYSGFLLNLLFSPEDGKHTLIRNVGWACCMLHSGFFRSLFFNPEDGNLTWNRSILWHSFDYRTLISLKTEPKCLDSYKVFIVIRNRPYVDTTSVPKENTTSDSSAEEAKARVRLVLLYQVTWPPLIQMFPPQPK
jgi:hypothetical protein